MVLKTHLYRLVTVFCFFTNNVTVLLATINLLVVKQNLINGVFSAVFFVLTNAANTGVFIYHDYFVFSHETLFYSVVVILT